MKIGPVKPADIPACIELIRSVFDGYVGCDYSKQGNATFYSFITAEALLARLEQGNRMICMRENERIVGFQEVRDTSHVCLFFVAPEYHSRGIGRALFEYLLAEIRKEHPEVREITVNSSIYAEPVYTHLGFQRTSPLREKDGIKFVPMRFSL